MNVCVLEINVRGLYVCVRHTGMSQGLEFLEFIFLFFHNRNKNTFLEMCFLRPIFIEKSINAKLEIIIIFLYSQQKRLGL